MATYQELLAQKEALEARIDEAWQKEVNAAHTKIQAPMGQYELTAQVAPSVRTADVLENEKGEHEWL